VSRWGPLVARARGLSGHLLAPDLLRTLAASDDRREFNGALVRVGHLAFLPNAPAPDDRATEIAIRRVAACRFQVLARWSRDCGDVLAPLLEDEDRRSLRAILRGALGGVAHEIRTAGLIPTATLPARALDELALLNDAGAIGAALLALGHPFARAVAEIARREHPDPFALDQAIATAWAARAVKAAVRGDDALRLYVERTIDLQNYWTSRLLAEQHADAAVGAMFVTGGRLVSVDDLQYAASSKSVEGLGTRLARRAAGTALAAALSPRDRDPDDAALNALIAEFRTRSLREPLGLAFVVMYILRLRAEHRTLLRMLWQLALGVPGDARVRAPGEAAA
jgi:vacuolar-type H+-ATPase subunit C/Vma6